MKTVLTGTATIQIPVNDTDIGISDPGGYFGGPPLTLADVLALIGSGTLTGYLRSSGGEVHVIDTSHATLTGTATFDLANGNVHPGTLTGNVTISTTGWPASGSRGVLQWKITGDGASTPTFAGHTWIGSAPGVIGAGDVLHGLSWSDDAGTVIWGAVAGDDASSAALAALVAKSFGYSAHGNMGATETFNAATGWHSGTFDANCTFTLTPDVADTSSLFLELAQSTGGHTLTLPASVVNKAALEAAQDTTAGTTSFLILLSRDSGTNWYGGWWGGSGGGTAASTVTDETTFGITPAVGTDTEYARQDHTHGSPSTTAVQNAGRWERVTDPGSSAPPVDTYSPDGTEFVYSFVPV